MPAIGERLMRDIERFARHHDRSLLVLDTVTDSPGYRLLRGSAGGGSVSSRTMP